MNTFGRLFRVTTWGESHGPSVGCVVDGCPSNLKVAPQDIQLELDRRRPGQSELTTPRREADEVEMLSGIFEGRTLGTPIAMMVRNTNVDPSKYRELMNKPRPGHADFAWRAKFGHVDWRGGGRSSARETVGRVAAGALAGRLLTEFGIEVIAYTKQIGPIRSDESLDSPVKGVRDLIDANAVRTLDMDRSRMMEEAIKCAQQAGDSLGGVVECVAFNVPSGLGEPVFGKLTSELAAALMSIPASKGVEFGAGFSAASMAGSQSNDEFFLEGGKVRTRTNRAGGMHGGISNGMPLVMRVAFKPTASIRKRQNTVDLKTGKAAHIQVEGRHDPCVVPRAVAVVEAMAKLVLADQMMLSGYVPRALK
jgi:chorismate synthase